jgi:hypothetical protein
MTVCFKNFWFLARSPMTHVGHSDNGPVSTGASMMHRDLSALVALKEDQVSALAP